MSARQMRPDDVPHEYVMAAMKAAGLLHHDTARPALAAVLPMHRAEVLREAADEIERVAVADDGPAAQWNWWDAASIPASIAALLRDMADTNTTQET